eukprot:11205752-Karenia_brevis.AAC.1
MVQVLPFTEGTDYLGRRVCFNDFHETELHHRLNKGWAAFGKFRHVFCDRHYPVHQKLKLLDSVVSATVLYGSGTWTMTAKREQMLTTTMRKMIRKIVATPRKWMTSEAMGDLEREPYVDWIVRATHKAEGLMLRAGITDWVSAQRKRKQALFHRVSNCTDDRWAAR